MLGSLRPGSLAHARLSEIDRRPGGCLGRAASRRHLAARTIEEEIDGAGEEAALTVYRMVQEAWSTRCASQAESVEVSTGASGRDLSSRSATTGAGLPADFHMGFGLLGMSERVRRLGGDSRSRTVPKPARLIEATIPGRTRSIASRRIDCRDAGIMGAVLAHA
jgi:glucose-6-phosphate-specific signal transduction histidine kinase